MKFDKQVLHIGVVATSEVEASSIQNHFTQNNAFLRQAYDYGLNIEWHYIFKKRDVDGLYLDQIIGVEGTLMEYVKDITTKKHNLNLDKIEMDFNNADIPLYDESELVPCQFYEFHN